MPQVPSLSSTPQPGTHYRQPALKPFPAGVVAVLPLDDSTAPLGDLSLYTGWTLPQLNGFRYRTTWRRIVPTTRGQYDWSGIDQLQSLAAKYNKFYTLNIAAGKSTPRWAYDNIHITEYSLNDGSGTMPVPWQSDFQTLWFEFLQAFAARYDSDKRMRAIIPCGFMQDAGMILGNSVDEDPTLGMPHAGYPDVDTAYVAGAQAILTQYATLHKTTSFMLTNQNVFGTTQGGIDRATVINWFNATYGVRAGTMSTSLQATLTHTGTVRPMVVSGRQSLMPCENAAHMVNTGLYNPDNPSATFPQILDDLLKACLDNGGHYCEVYQPELQDARSYEVLGIDGAALRANVPLLQ